MVIIRAVVADSPLYGGPVMAVELAPRTGLIGRPRTNGLDLPPDLTFDEWRGVVQHVEMIVDASPWWLADAVAFGEAHFGERHSDALPTAEEDPTGASQSRLKQSAWMASVYPPGTRVPGLTYTHHRVAADLEPETRARVLRDAAAGGWSTRELIAVVKTRQAEAAAIDGASEPAVCAADAPWPTLADLLPEWRRDLERRAEGMPPGYVQGWLDALVETGNEACFENWRD